MITVNAGDELANDTEFLCWLEEIGIIPNCCFKLEVGEDRVVAHNYSINDEGKKYVNRETGLIATDEPLLIPRITVPVWITEKLEKN